MFGGKFELEGGATSPAFRLGEAFPSVARQVIAEILEGDFAELERVVFGEEI